ncbi:MAG: hypothetical protein GY803_20025 [Chloroflexi bacterium]|nr:hypothetical protein [Chloroflexota bacterium]
MNGANLTHLRAQWDALMDLFDVDERLSDEAFQDLTARYGEDGRYYHTLHHIQNILETLNALRPHARDFPAVQLAAWFHDIIYDVRANDNEEQSARYARRILQRLQIPPTTIAHVESLIRATTHANPCSDNPDFHVLLDADLATFSSDWPLQEEIARAIRQEFAFVPEDAYRAGRRQALQRFLQRDRIFYTTTMVAQYEERARQNIARAIALLD